MASYKGEDLNTTPTDGMVSEATRGLDWRKEHGRGGKWTIGVVPAGRGGMICTLHHGDGFRTEKTPARSRG